MCPYTFILYPGSRLTIPASTIPPVKRLLTIRQQPGAVSSPWLSAAARPVANSMGPRRMSRKCGTPERCVSISNPSDLEAGKEGTQRFRQQACVAAETSGPAFLKPHWVCSKEGPTSAHRLRATKEES